MARKRVALQILADMETTRFEQEGRAFVEGRDPVSGIGFRYEARTDHIELSTGDRLDLRDADGFAFLPCAQKPVGRVVARWIRSQDHLP